MSFCKILYQKLCAPGNMLVGGSGVTDSLFIFFGVGGGGGQTFVWGERLEDNDFPHHIYCAQ